MAKENELSKADIAALSAAGLVAGGGAAALKQGVRTNARLANATKTAQAQYEAAYRAREAIVQKVTMNGARPNAAIPKNSPLLPEFQAALAAEKAAIARIAQFKGQTSTLGKIGATPLLGGVSKAMSKMGTKGKIAAGVAGVGVSMLGSAAFTDGEDEQREKVYNKLRYGHYETKKQLNKRGTLTETGNIGEGGFSEEEFNKYYEQNKDAFGRQYGGHGNAVNMGSQLIAGIANPLAGLFGGVGADAWVNSAEDKFNMSMADSLASQAQGRRVRNNADNLYGEQFARGLMGGYKPMENMAGVDGGRPPQVIKPYVDPATAAAQQKAKMAYDAASDKDLSGAIMRPNAARDGGQRWFQDVNEMTSSGRDNPEDNDLRRTAQRGIMHAQGLISDEDFYGDMPAGAIKPAGATPAGAVTPQATTHAGVVQNAQSNLSNVGRPMNQNINIPPPTNPQDAESLMRTRSIMSGETNVAGAVGQSQTAYMNNKGMLTSNQQNNAVSDWRKSYWEGRGVRGFDYTPSSKQAQPPQPTIGPSTLTSRMNGPDQVPRTNRYADTSGYDYDMSGVPRHDMPAGAPVPLSPMRPTPDRRPPSPFNFAEPVPPPSPMRPNPTESPYGRFRSGSTPY